jgi:preprotein translocase subunit SecY
MADEQQPQAAPPEAGGRAKLDILGAVIKRLPAIGEPKTHLNFKQRLKWTGIILFIFLVLSQITIYGVSPTEAERFIFLELILGARIGSLLTLGIGPIVTASIILQLLVGSKVLPWDLKSREGKARFQGVQKLMTIAFAIFEAFAYVNFGVITPVNSNPSTFALLIGQLAFGGFLVLLMDEVVSKWGIGSGVSLFIAAGVTKQIFVRTLSPITPPGSSVPAGAIPAFITYIQTGELTLAALAMLPLIATLLVFFVVVYIQAIKVDIPLAFTSIRGFGRRWPLKFIYTSNMPVILTAALVANASLLGSMLYNRGLPLLGEFDANGQPTSGLMYFLVPPINTTLQLLVLVLVLVIFAVTFVAWWKKVQKLKPVFVGSVVAGLIISILAANAFAGLPPALDVVRAVTYALFYIAFSVIFSIIWVTTSGMDSESVAKQIEDLGMQIPGFRRDPRIVKEVLDRYIPNLALMGGIAVGGLAAIADLTGAIGTGTGILLTVMIIYNFYEIIASRYVEEMHPGLRKFFG